MKKIFCVIAVFFVMIGAVPAFSSCSKDEDAIVTGAACSIAELNSINKNGNFEENSKIEMIKERNLRPLRIHKGFSTIEESGCFWGQCLSKKIFRLQ